ncbi:unnamed protein product [Ambrosiozyma monospora]|uniref:Unnamed protein product n=1 Tax=Ambrosiozyma monospora TaxID=43982 RepID=A0A9W6YWX1_AMBMO|nr:unnamed protein product [Ambrosiozyma monospora]
MVPPLRTDEQRYSTLPEMNYQQTYHGASIPQGQPQEQPALPSINQILPAQQQGQQQVQQQGQPQGQLQVQPQGQSQIQQQQQNIPNLASALTPARAPTNLVPAVPSQQSFEVPYQEHDRAFYQPANHEQHGGTNLNARRNAIYTKLKILKEKYQSKSPADFSTFYSNLVQSLEYEIQAGIFEVNLPKMMLQPESYLVDFSHIRLSDSDEQLYHYYFSMAIDEKFMTMDTRHPAAKFLKKLAIECDCVKPITDLTKERYDEKLNYSEPYSVERKLNEFMFKLKINGYPADENILVDEAIQKAPLKLKMLLRERFINPFVYGQDRLEARRRAVAAKTIDALVEIIGDLISNRDFSRNGDFRFSSNRALSRNGYSCFSSNRDSSSSSNGRQAVVPEVVFSRNGDFRFSSNRDSSSSSSNGGFSDGLSRKRWQAFDVDNVDHLGGEVDLDRDSKCPRRNSQLINYQGKNSNDSIPVQNSLREMELTRQASEMSNQEVIDNAITFEEWENYEDMESLTVDESQRAAQDGIIQDSKRNTRTTNPATERIKVPKNLTTTFNDSTTSYVLPVDGHYLRKKTVIRCVKINGLLQWKNS